MNSLQLKFWGGGRGIENDFEIIKKSLPSKYSSEWQVVRETGPDLYYFVANVQGNPVDVDCGRLPGDAHGFFPLPLLNAQSDSPANLGMENTSVRSRINNGLKFSGGRGMSSCVRDFHVQSGYVVFVASGVRIDLVWKSQKL